MASLMIDMRKEAALHLTTILRLRPLTSERSRVESDDCQSYVQFTACQRMILFTIEASVREFRVDRKMPRSVLRQRFPEYAFVRRATTRSRRKNEVRLGLAGHRQLSPEALLT